MMSFLQDLRSRTGNWMADQPPAAIAKIAFPPAANDAPLILGRGVNLRGDIEAPSPVQVVGHVTGMIKAPAIVVERTARVEGTLAADVIICEGQIIDADIYANQLILKSGCELTGEVFCRDLQIEEGALFEGKHRRHPNPLSLAPPMQDRS